MKTYVQLRCYQRLLLQVLEVGAERLEEHATDRSEAQRYSRQSLAACRRLVQQYPEEGGPRYRVAAHLHRQGLLSQLAASLREVLPVAAASKGG